MAKVVARVYSEFFWIWCYPCSPERHCLFLWEAGLWRVDSKSVVELLASRSKWNHPERVGKKAYTKQFKLSTQSHRGNKSFRTMIHPDNGQIHSLGHCNIQSLVTSLRLVGSHLLIFRFERNQLVQLLQRRLKSQPLTCQHFAPLVITGNWTGTWQTWWSCFFLHVLNVILNSFKSIDFFFFWRSLNQDNKIITFIWLFVCKIF